MAMQRRHRKKLPTIWLMTDERIGEPALLAAVARLPKGKAGVIFRHYRTAAAERHALFDRIARIARRRRLVLMLGGTAAQAQAWRADGWHGRDRRRAGKALLHSRPVHDGREMAEAVRWGANIVLLSPLFPTRSHPGSPLLGRAGFAALARLAPMPVIALGGVNAAHRHMLKAIGASGWAAIDGLSGR
ncbi:thiamine phosphate synthase [Sphingobium sp. 22B]|uniref:thiamine phosphate synthase n=1 Tax=unclassified Sphingobium TaxID=2611147 RepID=UPI00078364A7|nr:MULTISPECIES: thiamine phosphate synthase [unclassified Sphingobium]KXU33225.1 thiamine phosphate synthase [Sphingobium sp. AM]KYC31552.1 thiamine phosphate synthase [Sphingobium sp. 22B]OAP30795.1 thiamine phosphate synthase [Sphingobium sp. 20006FA]